MYLSRGWLEGSNGVPSLHTANMQLQTITTNTTQNHNADNGHYTGAMEAIDRWSRMEKRGRIKELTFGTDPKCRS